MLEVLSPGLLSSVQDLGRPGWRRLGVCAGGAADRDALRVGNWLVGNADEAAGLEVTLTGPTLRVRQRTLIALTGGDVDAHCQGQSLPMWRPIALEAGSEVRIARVLRGARAYLAVAGGIDVPLVLGSRSTDLSSGFGGWQGRALRAGDKLPVFRAGAAVQRLVERLLDGQSAWRAAPWWVGPVEDLSGAVAMLHLLPGADLAALDPRVLRALRDGVWTVSPDSDRMGLRFDGPPVPRTPRHEQISAAVLPGTVQLPPDGLPIVLGVDAQTVGGYPRVGQVIRADLGRAMQLRPGERVRPVLITAAAANAAWLARQRNLSRMGQALTARWAKV